MLTTLSKFGRIGALAILVLGATAGNAFATHFRYGTISWVVPPASPAGTVQLNVELSFRASFFPGVGLGSIEDVGPLTVTEASNSIVVNTTEVLLTVTAFEPTLDLIVGHATITVALPLKATTYKVDYFNCCRPDTLLDNNANQNYDIWATIPFSTTGATEASSPTAAGVPITAAALNVPFAGSVYANDALGHALTYSLATSTQSGLVTPAPAGAPTLTVAANTGVITWTPTELGLAAVQFVVSDGQAQIVVDEILDILTVSGTTPTPTLTINGSTSPATVTTSIGIPTTISLVAGETGTSQLLIASGDLPTGMVTTPSLPLAWPSPPSATVTLNWTPQLGDFGTHVMVFTVTDQNGRQVQNSVTVNVVTAKTIYLSGIIRDFGPTDPDFASADGDNAIRLVSTTLGGDGKPVFAPTGTSTTVSSASTFNQWWNRTGETAVYSITLSNFVNQNPNVFNFSSAPFYPIDGLLGGNSGQSHNNYFTYEIHSYYTYASGDVLTYSSSDDLWVFINGKLAVDLGGVHTAARTAALNVDAFAASAGLFAGQTYPMAFFYAHRGSTHSPSMGVQAETVALCDPLSPLASTPLPTLAGAAATNPDGSVRLVSSSVTDTSGAAWTSSMFDVLAGFAAEFDFKISPSGGGEGLAFVVQSQSANARGGDAGNLGYAGIADSVAVEFDVLQDTSLDDPAYQHVSVHTAYTAQNSASEVDSIGINVPGDANTGQPFTFNDGATHHARVEYDAPAAGDTVGWFRVFVDHAAVPATQAQVNPANLAPMFQSGAYLGFTSSNGDTAAANVDVSGFQISLTQVSGAASHLLAAPSPQAAAVTGAVTLQLADICSAPIVAIGQSASISATMTSDTYSTPVSVTDNGDGTYTLGYTPPVGGLWTLAISVGGVAVTGSPFSVSVTPGTPTVTVQGATFVYNGSPRTATGSATGALGENLGPLTFTYNGAPQAINAATYTVVGSFAGSAHYAAATASATLTITQASPTVSVSNATFTYDGTPHAAAGAATGVNSENLGPLTFSYTPGGSTTPIQGGTYLALGTFAGNTNYTSGSASGTLTIGPATPTVQINAPTITYDGSTHPATGSATGVNNENAGPLTFTYNGSPAPPVNAGTYTVVGSSPASANYVAASATTTLTINQAMPTVTVTGGAFTYDTTPHPATGSATGVLNENLGPLTFTYNSGTAVPVGAGSYAVIGAYTGSTNYVSAQRTATITIAQATPPVVWPAPAGIVYGTPLTAAQLDATSPIAGVFAYSPGAGAIPGAGPQLLSATFTPADAVDYTTITATVPLVVSQATPVVTWTSPSAIPAGTALGASQLDATSSIPGTFAYTPPAGTILPAGTQALSVVFTPLDGIDYTSASASVTIDVRPGGLSTFVAFSRDMTWLRAGATAITGDVGANERRLAGHTSDTTSDDGDRDDVTVRIGVGATVQQPSSRVLGDTVLLLNKSSVENVVDNFLLAKKGSAELGTTTSSLTIPFTTLPAFPVVTPGTTSISVAKNKTMTLAAGSYGTVQVGNGGTLILTGGLYQLFSLDLDQTATVLFEAPSELRIALSLTSRARAKVTTDPAVPGLHASQIAIYVDGLDANCPDVEPDDDGDDAGPTAVQIGAQNVIQANVYAGNGSVWLKSRTQATGAFIGLHVRIGTNATLTLDSAFE